ncbi:MAG: hypothetical protein ACRENX_08180 [Candidatus Dormibacteria bacterium]
MDSRPVTSPRRSGPDSGDRRAAGTIQVRRPIGEVFDYLADGRHGAAWQSGVSTSELLRYGGGVGAIYRQALHDTVLGGRNFEYRVVQHYRPVLLGVEAIGLAGHPRASFRLEAVRAAATAITVVVELSGSDFEHLRPEGAVRWRDRLVTSLPHLKSCLEQSHP